MSVTYQREESIAVITMNDGKVNALGPDMLAAINAELDRAEGEDAGAVVIAGNDRVFSGGFDLKVFKSGDVQASIGMLKAGFELSHRLLSFPKPVVAACTGHDDVVVHAVQIPGIDKLEGRAADDAGHRDARLHRAARIRHT